MQQADKLQREQKFPASVIEALYVDQCRTNKQQTSKQQTTSSSTNWWPSISSFLQGLSLGTLTNGIVLVTAISFWLIPKRSMTGVVITNEIPPGTVLLFSGNLSKLRGSTYRWLLCDGSEVSRLEYADLFDVIGVTYGAGNGNDTFNLPDFRSRFPLGSNSSNDTQLVSGGTSTHVLSIAELPVHAHNEGTLFTLNSGLHSHTFNDTGCNYAGPTINTLYAATNSSGSQNGGSSYGGGIVCNQTNPVGTSSIIIAPDGLHSHTISGQTGDVGGNQPIDKMPPYQTVHYIIRG